MKKLKYALFTVLILFASSVYSNTFFSGYAGGKVNYSATNATYDPDLTFQAFFAGQFNFAENSWGRMEFSVNTSDLLNFTFFDESATIMNAEFQIDELSFINRSLFNENLNYFSAYMGTYDPIGSDIFLQRYFGIEPIQSKLSESWLGMAGSIIYPHFGVGISDIIRFASAPLAFGGYAYLNKDDSFVMNFDFRGAGVFRLFTFDIAAGVGLPLSSKYIGDDVIVVVDTLDIHTGATILIGNNYTNSFFLQGGFKADIDKTRQIPFQIDAQNIYLIAEPRFVSKSGHFNISAFCLPQITVRKLLNVDDPIGINLNIYSDTLAVKNKVFTFGCHSTLSFIIPNSASATYKDFFTNIKDNFKPENMNVNITPYMSTAVLNGTLHAQLKIQIMSFPKQQAFNAFSADIGYKCKI